MHNCAADNLSDTKNSPLCSWKNRTRCQKNFILISSILLVFILFTSLLFFLLYVKTDVCSTQTCVKMSKELSKYIYAREIPCKDFYRFSCGNFLQNTNLDNLGSRSVQDIMEDEIQFEIRNMLERPIQLEEPVEFNLAKKFYRACMNESAIEAEGLKRIKQIFKQMGGWPTVDGDNWREVNFDWRETVYTLRGIGVNFDFFFRVSVDRDEKNSSRYILAIHGIGTAKEISKDVQKAYLDYMVDLAKLFGANAATAREDSEDVLTLLSKVAKISEESRALNKSGVYELYSLKKLQTKYPSINWFQYINRILQTAERIRYDDEIVVTASLYLERLEKVLEDTSKRTLANFIFWHTLQHLINYMPKKVLYKAYENLGNINGKTKIPIRWKMCLKATEGRMGSVLSTAYIRNNFDDNTQSKVVELIRNIKTNFKFNLQGSEWLDQQTKKMILDKLISSTEEIMAYDDLMEAEEENRVYNEVDVHEGKLLDSALRLDYVSLNLHFSKLRKPFRENWLKNYSFVTGVKIYYFPKENILRFPIGIFRGIYYQTDRPKYMNYAILGSIIAHEISHIFIEAQYGDLPGELRNWWSPKSLVKYDEKLQCLANQYRNFEVVELGKHLNPLKTRDEDMADLAGMKVSYDTYIKWVQENGAEPRLPGLNYSPSQLFWISAAIHHCSKYSTQTLERYIDNYQWSPQQYRVNGPLQNIEEFAFDFSCPPGSQMNPQVKCVVW